MNPVVRDSGCRFESYQDCDKMSRSYIGSTKGFQPLKMSPTLIRDTNCSVRLVVRTTVFQAVYEISIISQSTNRLENGVMVKHLTPTK